MSLDRSLSEKQQQQKWLAALEKLVKRKRPGLGRGHHLNRFADPRSVQPRDGRRQRDKTKKAKKPGPDQPDKAEEFRRLQMQDKDGVIPPDGIQKLGNTTLRG